VDVQQGGPSAANSSFGASSSSSDRKTGIPVDPDGRPAVCRGTSGQVEAQRIEAPGRDQARGHL